MKNRERMKRGFNRLSPFYDAAAFLVFGRSLWKAQSWFLNNLPHCKNVLVIGGGTGRILEELLRLNIADRYYYLDISDEMIARAKQRVERNYRHHLPFITFHAATINEVPSSLSFDLVITPFVLDMIGENELYDEMQMISERLEEEGTWLFSDFNYPVKKGAGRRFSKFTIQVLYFFFRLFTGITNKRLPGFAQIFTRLGFETQKEKQFLNGMLVTCIYKRPDVTSHTNNA